MNSIKRNKANEIYKSAQNGEIDAYNIIIESCNEFVKKKAIIVYKEITNNIIKYYNIQNNNYHIPSSLLDLDDIVQDLLTKSMMYVSKFLKRSCRKYFSSYLSHMFSSYLKKYINDKTDEITEKLNNTININVDSQVNAYNVNNNIFIKNEIIENISNDRKLSKYIPFINLVFEIKDLEEISKITGLDIKDIKLKIEKFSELYLKYMDKYDSKLQYITNGKILEDIKNGTIYNMLYFKKETIFILHDIYHRLSQKYSISYKVVKQEFCDKLYNNIKQNIDYFINCKDIDQYYNNILNEIKITFILYKETQLKYVLSKKWDRYWINEKEINTDEVINLIQQGQIYQISPYKEYLDIYFESIYKELNQHIFLEKNVVVYHLVNIINCFIAKEAPILEFNFDNFNGRFLKHLNNKKDYYIKHKLSNDNKLLIKRM